MFVDTSILNKENDQEKAEDDKYLVLVYIYMVSFMYTEYIDGKIISLRVIHTSNISIRYPRKVD